MHIFIVCVPISLVVPQFTFDMLQIDVTHGLMVPASWQHLSFCALTLPSLESSVAWQAFAGICYCTLMVLSII